MRGCFAAPFTPLYLFLRRGCLTENKSDIDVLKEQISRLMAALEDVNFECQRLEIINTNLDFQLKEANRELAQNIAVLQALEEENESLKRRVKELEKSE